MAIIWGVGKAVALLYRLVRSLEHTKDKPTSTSTIFPEYVGNLKMTKPPTIPVTGVFLKSSILVDIRGTEGNWTISLHTFVLL